MDTALREGILTRVEEALESVRPYLKADGGDVELLELADDMVVKIRLHGACRSCQMSAMTMKAGIEEAVRRAAPEVKGVEEVRE